MRRGKRNLISDVSGVLIGNAENASLASGVTVALFEPDAVAAVAITGGAPAGRDQECLALESSVDRVHALVLSGGSSFGLDAATGVQTFLRENQRGLAFGGALVPIAPQAICFDLLNGGDKSWGRIPPYAALGFAACENAGEDFALGTAGAGFGATTADLKGGLGSASVMSSAGHMVGALVVANALGSAVAGGGPHFWAAPWELSEEFGGFGLPQNPSLALNWKGREKGSALSPATTIAIVATDAVLTKPQAKRLAIAASGGLSRGLRLAHALYDGDSVFAAATGKRPIGDAPQELIELCALAADCLTRAIARGVYEAASLPFAGALPAWRDKFGAKTNP